METYLQNFLSYICQFVKFLLSLSLESHRPSSSHESLPTDADADTVRGEAGRSVEDGAAIVLAAIHKKHAHAASENGNKPKLTIAKKPAAAGDRTIFRKPSIVMKPAAAGHADKPPIVALERSQGPSECAHRSQGKGENRLFRFSVHGGEEGARQAGTEWLQSVGYLL